MVCSDCSTAFLRVRSGNGECAPRRRLDVRPDLGGQRVAVGRERSLSRFDVGTQPQCLASQPDSRVEVLELHRQPVAARRGRKLRAVRCKGLAQSSHAAVRSCGKVAAAGEFARNVVPRRFQRACQLRQRRPRHEAFAHDDATPAGALDATIERGKRLLETGDRAPTLILQFQQSQSVDLVVCDPPHHCSDWIGFSDCTHVEGLVDGVRQAFGRGDGGSAVVPGVCTQVGQDRAIEGGEAIAKVAHAPRQRFELTLHVRQVDRRVAGAAQCHETRGRKGTDDEREAEHQPDADRQAQ